MLYVLYIHVKHGIIINIIGGLFMEKESTGKHTGTGCNNVYKRLQLVYGGKFECLAISTLGEGTIITIKIPFN